MLIPVVLALLTASAPPQDTVRGVIRGTVQSEPTGLPVRLAVVEADDGRRTVHAITDSTGAYRLQVVGGEQMLRVRHLEHAPYEVGVTVPAGGEVEVGVSLVHRPITLATVRVLPPADPRADSIAAPRPDVELVVDHHAALDAAFGDPIGQRPGDAETVNGDALYVRGSAANLQLVLLDGAPVYAPFHMGGLIDTFEPDVVGSARMYLGGAPARYDGGLSYVMDLSTRSGRERPAAAGMLDMVSAAGRVEGPLGAARYLGSVRTVHGASLVRLDGGPFPYDFADGLLRVDLPLPEGGISATLFANTEGVRVDTLPGGRERQAGWGNLAGSIRYRGRFEGADVEMTLAGGRYDADLPLSDRTRYFNLVGRSERVRAGLDFLRAEGPIVLRYGASFEHTVVRYRAYEPQPVKKLLRNVAPGATAGGYLDGTWQPSRFFVLRGGVRADAFSVGGVGTLAPRLSATVVVGDGATLTLAGGRYHQYIRVPRRIPFNNEPGNFADAARIPTDLAVGGATHLSLELDQQMDAGVRLGLEGFYKRFSGLPSNAAADTLASTAHTSGVDVWVRRTTGGLTGWFGYSLTWTWRSEIGTEAGMGAGGRGDGRQTVSAGIKGLAWKHTDVGVRLAYGSGLPGLSSPRSALPDGVLDGGSIPGPEPNAGGVDLDTDAPLNAVPDGFLRLDLEISRTWTPTVAGRSTQVTPYLRVINDLDRRDGLFYRYFGGEEGGGIPGIGALPLVPVFGFSWKI
jgi:hypothetical protein